MKNTALTFAAAACLISAVSCNKASTSENDYTFSSVADKYVMVDPTLEDDDDVPTPNGAPLGKVDVSINLMMPTAICGNDITALRDSILSKANVTVDNDKYLYKEEGLKISDEAANAECGQERIVNATVTHLSEQLAVWEISSYGYFGGAHGGSSTQYINYYVPGNEMLTYKNLFTKGFKAAALKEIKSWLVANDYSDMVFSMNEILVPKNFYVDGQKITFVYGEYEIAPYAAGIIEVPVYIWSLSQYLTPLGKKAFNVTEE